MFYWNDVFQVKNDPKEYRQSLVNAYGSNGAKEALQKHINVCNSVWSQESL